VLKPKDGQQWQAIAKDCIMWLTALFLLIGNSRNDRFNKD
jgi:hypothetical protein